MSIVKENIVLSLVIFSHGWEEFGREFLEPSLLDFYTNKVRVFSRACVPGIPSITSSSSHYQEVSNIMRECNSNPTVNTKEILCGHMVSIKPTYVRSVSAYSTPALTAHKDKSCSLSTFLHNKTFQFEDSPGAGIDRNNYYGIFVVDIRKQKIYEDGTIEYESIFNPGRIGPSNVDKHNLIHKDAMTHFIKTILKIKKLTKEVKSRIDLMYNNFLSENKTDLIKIYELCVECGVDYLNIVDNSCRLCQPGTPALHPSSIDDIYCIEQEQSATKPEFGGNKSKKSKKRSTKKRTRRFTKR